MLKSPHPQFAGYSSDALAERLNDCKASLLVTADSVWRGEKLLNLKAICDEGIAKATQLGHTVGKCIVVSHFNRVTPGQPASRKTPPPKYAWVNDRDFWWHDEMQDADTACYPEWMDAEDPLFMLYTSGSTGKPKGVLHTTAGYLLYAATTFKLVFDYKPDDIYWCTADIGWITGHTYGVYGPLANAATTVMVYRWCTFQFILRLRIICVCFFVLQFEGTPFYPANNRFWEVIEKYKVTQFYTAPTAIRALMRFGEDPVKKHDLTSLRYGSVTFKFSSFFKYFFVL